jgi:hypothetical protein
MALASSCSSAMSIEASTTGPTRTLSFSPDPELGDERRVELRVELKDPD